jgi:hypothetical protein
MAASEEPSRPGETAAERADRNFVELPQGLRVAVTGVQVLFAFLLTVPFASGPPRRATSTAPCTTSRS